MASLLVGSVSGLVGCSSSKGYTVELENAAQKLIRARIVLDPALRDDVTLDSIDLRPGETGVLGPVQIEPGDRGKVSLSVSQPAEIGLPPAQAALEPGEWAYEATDQSNFGVDGVRLRKVGTRERGG